MLVKVIDTIFRENWVSELDVLNFRDLLEGDLRLKTMFHQLKSSVLNTYQLCSLHRPWLTDGAAFVAKAYWLAAGKGPAGVEAAILA